MSTAETDLLPGHEADARFMRSVLAASDDCIKVLSLDGRLTFMSEGGQRVMEVSDFNSLKGCPWPDFWDGGGNADARASIDAARAGRSSRFQGAANTALGNPRWWDVQVSPIFGADGLPESILSVSRDITALKLGEEHLRLLALELQHRIKNTITLVQAIAGQSLAAAGSLDEAKTLLSGRLRTLSNAQDLLTQSVLERARLQEIVEGAVKPHDGAMRVRCSGPEIEISSKCALAMSLAIHELATNATKYGSLSVPGGRVEVHWRIDGTGFHFEWRETGGPAVQPPSRLGFGSRMIQRALAGYFGGDARIDYRPDGIVATLNAPVAMLSMD